jgi:VanZ family protein
MYRRLTIALSVLVLYGSLYPLQFSAPSPAFIERFLTQLNGWTGPGDALGNVALFVPWAATCMGWFQQRWPRLTAAAATMTVGLVLAFVAQVAQLWVPARDPRLGDIAWNALGCAAGVAASIAWLHRSRAASSGAAVPVIESMLMLAAVASLVFPGIPSLDRALLVAHVRELAHAPDYGAALDAAMPMTILVAMLPAALGERAGGARLAIWAVIAALAVPLAMLLVVQSSFGSSALAGCAVGAGLGVACRTDGPGARPSRLVLILGLSYLIDAWAPFRLREGWAPMEWMPFASLLQGAMIDNSRQLLTQAVVLTALLHALTRLGSPLRGASIVVAVAALGVELSQCAIETRHGDATAPALVILAAWGLAALQEPAPVRGATARQPSLLRQRRANTETRRASAEPPAQPHPTMHPAWLLGVLVVPMAAGMHLMLRMPGVPYNVSELFRWSGHPAALAVFALALLWLGAGPAWLGRHLAARSAPERTLTIGAVGVSLVSLALVAAAVTDESLDDVAGANNLQWYIVHRAIWGEAWQSALAWLDAPAGVGFVERCGRYAALLGPLPILLGGWIALVERARAGSVGVRWITGYLAAALPTLWLCKSVAFTWSSTDNLNELIARTGPAGLSGGFYLYLLLVLLCLSAWAVARTFMQPRLRPVALASAAAASITAVALGWALLNAGLEPAVRKYELVYSGAQFLLGPDRTHLLDDRQLFVRWTVLVLATLCVVAAGIVWEARLHAWWRLRLAERQQRRPAP